MNQIKNWLKTKIKFLSLLLVALIISQILFPAKLIATGGPKFNFLEGDYELLRGANSSQGETKWQDPVSAKNGDVIALVVYYHNGIEDTTAINTKIKVQLPTELSEKITAQGELSADNTESVKDTLTIKVDKAAKLEYLKGTTKWFPEGSQTPQNLPDGITSGGVNIGNIKGCWQFAGFVVFQAQLVVPGHADLTIDKKVANSTKDSGTQNWQDENSALPGDILAYRIFIQNPGTATANEVFVKDVLPLNVSYLTGTTKLYTSETGTGGQPLADGITVAGLNLGNFQPGAANSAYIVFQAKISPNLASGTHQLINTATIQAKNVSQKQDTAKTIVTITPPSDVNLSIVKKVRNLTKDETDFVKSNTVRPGDILEYKVSFSISGDTKAENVKVKDILPSVVGVPVNLISGSVILSLNNSAPVSVGDDLVGNGHSLGNLNPGDSGFFTFKVKIGTCPQIGAFDLINIAKISATNSLEKQDFAKSVLTVNPPVQPYFQIDKKVANISQSETNWSDANIAVPGDVLQYRIWFKNTGDGTATQVRIKDILPPGVSLVSGSGILYIGNDKFTVADDLVTNGVQIPDLIAGQDGYITFKIQTNSDLANNTVLTDTAMINSQEGARAQDSASTTIKIIPKPVVETPTINIDIDVNQEQHQNQNINIPQGVGKVLGAKKLPPTGGMILIVLVLTGLITAGYYYYHSQKSLKNSLIQSRLL